MHQQSIDQLANQVSGLIKTKKEIQIHASKLRNLRQQMRQQETSIQNLMTKLDVSECVSNDVCVQISYSKKHPSASFKNVLPLIQRFFRATPEQMNNFLQEIKVFKQSNSNEITKLVYRSHKKKPTPPVPQQMTASPSTPSLASTLMSY